MFSTRIRNSFPLKNDRNSRKTSEPDLSYNCFGWAAKNVLGSERCMAPVPNDYFWPLGVERSRTLASFVEAFRSLGFEVCPSSDFEEGVEKIVIYASGEYAEHAARQKPCGKWTSKLGLEEDIEHDTPEVLSGGRWGNPAVFMKRAIVTPQ